MTWPVTRDRHVGLADLRLELGSRIGTRLHRPHAADRLKAARNVGLLSQSKLRTMQMRRSRGLDEG